MNVNTLHIVLRLILRESARGQKLIDFGKNGDSSIISELFGA